MSPTSAPAPVSPHLSVEAGPAAPPALRRVLTFGPLVLYGLGVIVGAGIAVALGEVIARAGSATPSPSCSRGLPRVSSGSAGWADLAGRFLQAAGAAALWRLQARGEDRPGDGFSAPRWVAPAALAGSLILLLSEFLRA